jgi:hypothetical protein
MCATELETTVECQIMIILTFAFAFYAVFPSCKPVKMVSLLCAGIFKQSLGARGRLGIGLSYRPARLHSLAELVPRNRFLGSLKV